MNRKIGFFDWDEHSLPVFRYTGDLPFHAVDKAGNDTHLPEDPWFLLGNYQLTLFTHVSGAYELISGQRSWARLNTGKAPGTGVNHASVTIDGESCDLCGMNSLAADAARCERSFGCGYAKYIYHLDGARLIRTISVAPSESCDGGASAFLTQVEIRNESGKPIQATYREGLTVNFAQYQFGVSTIEELGNPVLELQGLTFRYDTQASENLGEVKISCEAEDPLLCPDPYTQTPVDGFPPTVFIRRIGEGLRIEGNGKTLEASGEVQLEAGESRTIAFATGFYFPYTGETAEDEIRKLSPVHTGFSEAWASILPAFSEEQDEGLRRELIWNAYVLEAMATYSHYYQETKIPQGTFYDYCLGMHLGSRDNFQHTLPLIYYHPELAKSSIRYMLKRITSYGEIRWGEYGVGSADNLYFTPSDQQLYFFLLISEYLRVTKDFAFLQEMVPYSPGKGAGEGRVIDHIRNCFTYLRNVIGTGPHGLVKLWNADWNDMVYHLIPAPYNLVVQSAESHMNSAMAISILQNLIPLLTEAAEKEKDPLYGALAESMRQYRDKQLKDFLKDLGDRSFPRRMYFGNKAYGEENMYLEPMGFTLQIRELSDDFKQKMYEEMKKRVYSGEKLGARQQEDPEFEAKGFIEKGSNTNGGVWWALNGPIIIGVAGFDKEEAEKLLQKMTWASYSGQFPDYWSSYWSAADSFNASILPTEGLPGFLNQPVFCAHSHAWVLYCYYKLHEEMK
ncbi:MAG: hypothetical protein IKG51_04925 [Firmicutes bacterium]|nr:hypothetical protein [Bacillota bacterium]